MAQLRLKHPKSNGVSFTEHNAKSNTVSFSSISAIRARQKELNKVPTVVISYVKGVAKCSS